MRSGRLLVVSNRGPVETARGPEGVRLVRTVGGLASALDESLRARGGMWIAWVGPHAGEELAASSTGLAYPIRAVRLKERELSHYYAGFSNQVLWPICHMFPSRVNYEEAYWTAYRQANERFAAIVVSAVEPGDLVWVHDFHLCLVPGLLRSASLPARIGVFWHIPFPPPEVFGIIRGREELLMGLLGADLIGFQTDRDVENFLASVRRFLDLPVAEDRGRVELPGRAVQTVVLPIGVNYQAFHRQGQDAAVRERAARLRAALGAESVLLGVDRLDYTKGVYERLRGYERFLDRHPDWRRRVCLVQITVPSRDRVPQYREMKRAIDETVGRIVGRFTAEGRSPLQYLYTAMGHEALAAYYVAADVALVTPLRDGMNLVAKEYVACRGGQDGVLLLSEFAGAAQELHEAVLVNPYDVEAIRRGLEVCMHMSPEERRRRMRRLDRRVAEGDITWWTNTFLERLAA